MMKIKKVLIDVIRICIIITSVALVGAAAAPYIDPSGFDWPAFFGLMYPYLLLLHLVLFFCYFLIKKNKLSLLFLIPAVATINIFLNSFGFNFFKSSTKPSINTFKLTTYNVHTFKDANDFKSSVRLPIFQLIEEEQPDILCMQDFQTYKKGDSINIAAIKAILKTGHYYNGPKDKKLFPTKSIITFSKYPIVNTGFIILSEGGGGNQAVFTDINKNGKIIRVYNVHFESLGFKPYDYEKWKKGNIFGKFKFLFKVKDRFSEAFANRSEQVKMVKKHAESCPYPFIIAGDFNDTPASFAVNYTANGMKNAFREMGKGYTVTFNGGLPDFQIDYVMVNPAFNVLDYNVIRKQLSDHYPVVARLNF